MRTFAPFVAAVASAVMLRAAGPTGAANGIAQPPYQDRFATVNGLRLHYLDWGGVNASHGMRTRSIISRRIWHATIT